MIGEDDDSVEQILFGVGFFIMLIVMIPICIWCSKGGVKLNRLMKKYEVDSTGREFDTHEGYSKVNQS